MLLLLLPLLLLQIQSEKVCQTGLDIEPELHWELDKQKHYEEAQEKCRQIKHTFQRTARECKEVTFLSIEVCCHRVITILGGRGEGGGERGAPPSGLRCLVRGVL